MKRFAKKGRFDQVSLASRSSSTWQRTWLAMLVALLLAGQHAMFAHAMSHLRPSDSSTDKTLPDRSDCQKCTLFAKISSVAPGIAGLPDCPNAAESIALSSAKSFFYLAVSPYLSRAPPRLV